MALNSDSLSSLNLTEEELIMLKIKAAMYTNGDTQEYIKGLILSDKRSVPDYKAYCTSCHEVKEMISVNRNEEFILSECESSMRVVVESVPKHKCSKCGSITSNMKLSAAIEEALETKLPKMRSDEKIPFQVLVS